MIKPSALLFLLIAVGCRITDQQPTRSVQRIEASSDSIRYTGRVKDEKDSVTIYWSATTVAFKFTGGTVKAMLRDEHARNYFNVVVDGDSMFYFRPDSVRRLHTLAENLKPGEHTIELIKRNEWSTGKTWFYGLEIEGGELLALPPANKRVIEFYGNSITAGYAIEDYSGADSPDSIYTNNYDTYAAITARHFKADLYCTVKSGIGILVSWFPLTMPELYDRLDPSDADSKWDFRAVTPQVVVINLFQNDSWLINMPDHPSFKERFGTKKPGEEEIVGAYKSFVGDIRSKYPGAYIICALGSMDATKTGSPWPGYVSRAVNELGDEKISTLFFPFTNKGGHPRKEDNLLMSEQLIAFIEKNVSW